MTTIRSRLFILLLPPLVGFLILFASILYFQGDKDLSAILTVGLVSVAWVVGSVWFISYKITKPVQKLKSAALHLASGHYEDSINVEGPQEIEELANTLNTMRECLLEHISRLTDYPLAREKLYGEYECAEILQFEMLEKAIESSDHAPYSIEVTSLPSSPLYGLKFSMKGEELYFEEAETEGFQGIYQLLTEKTSRTLRVSLANSSFEAHKFPEPLFWSAKEGRLTPLQKMEKGDILIIFNTGLTRQIPHPQILRDWFSKILKHFAKDGIDLTTSMIQSELNFFAKKYVQHEDIRILLITLDADHPVR